MHLQTFMVGMFVYYLLLESVFIQLDIVLLILQDFDKLEKVVKQKRQQ